MAQELEVARVGLIGLGAVSEQHLEAYRNERSIKVLAAADLDCQRRKRVARRGDLHVYADHRRMLESEALDIVCVLTPPITHAELVVDCAKAGVNVLCEKPLALDLEAAEWMVEQCAIHNVELFYGSSYRFLPAVIAARKIIENGELGQVLLLREAVVGGRGGGKQKVLPPHHCPLGGPGGTPMGLVDHGIHLIDVLPWLARTQIRSVFGRGNLSGKAMKTEYAILELANEAVVQLTYNEGSYGAFLPQEGIFSWGTEWGTGGLEQSGAWRSQPGSIEIHGSEGALRLYHYANALFAFNRRGVQQVALNGRPAPGHFSLQISTFAQDLKAGRTASVPGEVGVEALRALLAIYDSSTLGRTVELR